MSEFNIEWEKNKKIYIYYLILHLICMSWTELSMVPPHIILRLLVTSAIFLPLIKYFWLAPSVFVLFLGIRFNSVAPFGYIPQMIQQYYVIFFLIAILHQIIYSDKILYFNKKQFFLFLFIYLLDVANLKFFSPIIPFAILLFVFYNTIKDSKTLYIYILSYVILSLSLSIYYFMFASKFTVSYGTEGGLERSTWIDPNYFGVLVGLGAVFSIYFLLNNTNYKVSKYLKTLFITCIGTVLIVILVQASRGSILALTLSGITILFYSHVKLQYKILFIIFTSVCVMILYNQGVFDLLFTRIEEDDGSGSGRSEIWLSKIDYFLKDPICWVGSGYGAAYYEFPPFPKDCHNEYISILINYGVFGIIYLFYEVLRIFLKTQNNRALVISLLCFGLVSFMTLSPISNFIGWMGIPLMLPILYRLTQKI